MRSTGFVFLSIFIHGLAVAAVAISPQRIVESAGHEIEVAVGPEADQSGVSTGDESTTEVESTAATEAEQAPQTEKKIVKAKAAPVKTKKVKATKVVKAETPAAEVKTEAKTTEKITELPPKKLDPTIEDNPVVTAADSDSQDQAKEAKEQAQTEQAQEKPEFIPVKDSVPDGVEAATDTDTDTDTAKTDDSTEAASEDLQKTADPAPVEVSEAESAVEGESTTQEAEGNGNGVGMNTDTAATSTAKGGATKEGAVAYTDLRQMNGNKPPRYPIAARKEGRQGEVDLLYRVTKEGGVTDIQVVRSSGSQDLDQEAVRAIAKFRFVPGQEGWARHPVNFTLKGETAALPSRLRTKVGGAQSNE